MVPTPPMLRSLASAASSLVASAQSCTVLTPPSTPVAPPPSTTAAVLNLADYDANTTTGFMPLEPICSRLPAYYEPWELALELVNCGHDSVLSLGEDTSPDALAKRASSEIWRRSIRDMPLLSTDCIANNVHYQRRAHHVLAYLAHFYIHSLPPTSSSTSTSGPVIPSTIAIPLCSTSTQLGITPILTYADTVNWNIVPRDPTKPLAPGNLRTLTTFTGTDDEDAFYQCCANIELFGTDALELIVSYENLANKDSLLCSSSASSAAASIRTKNEMLKTIASKVEQLTILIDDLTDVLRGCHGACSPKVFYDLIRPWFRGSSSGSSAWVYEGVSADLAEMEWVNLSGPSGGQSALMHSLDLFLDVDHAMEKEGDERTPVEARKGNDRLFMRRMQKYMPAPHRAFLHRLASSPLSLRQFAVSLSTSSSSSQTHAAAQDVIIKYNAAVAALRKFRDAHLKIACVYVVAQAKKAAAEAAFERQEQEQREQVHAHTHAQVSSSTSSPSAAGCPVAAMLARLQAEGDADLLAVCPVSGKSLQPAVVEEKKKEPIRGTGGTELVALLRSCRDATTRAMIPTSPSRA